MVNLGNPAQALKTSILPLMALVSPGEFIISEAVKIHPMALRSPGTDSRRGDTRLHLRVLGRYRDEPGRYFVDRLSEGVGMIAGAFYPRPVIVRLSDFKTNEYATLLGGKQFEPHEENPMIGFRGASRYADLVPRWICVRVSGTQICQRRNGPDQRQDHGAVLQITRGGPASSRSNEESWPCPGENGLEVYVMSELPANVLRAADFAKIFDGFSIGSNDLTQMVLGVDRDSEVISRLSMSEIRPFSRCSHLHTGGKTRSAPNLGSAVRRPAITRKCRSFS